MSPEAQQTKKGCCLGGCMGWCFWLILSFCAGWLLCNMEHNGWNFSATWTDSYARAGKHIKDLWEYVSGKAGEVRKSGMSSAQKHAKAVPPIPGAEDWSGIADESLSKAKALLQRAQQSSGAERDRLLRVARKELQAAYENYIKAEQLDSGNQELTSRIAEIGRLLEQLNK